MATFYNTLEGSADFVEHPRSPCY